MAVTYLQSLLGARERILLVARQHWLLLARALALETALVLALGVALALATPVFPPAWFAAPLVLIPILKGFYDYLVWWNRQYVVTTRRVIQLSGLLDKNVTDSSLEKVNDVHMVQSFLGRVFDYGDVQILTASELGANRFRRIAEPVRFKTAMLNAKEALGVDEIPGRGVDREDIPALIAELDTLRRQGALNEAEFERKKAELLARI